MAKKASNRVQIDLTDEAMRQLNHLKEITDANTNAEVFKEAMASHAWLIERYQRGEKLLVKQPNGEMREVELLNFSVATVGKHRQRILEDLASQEVANMRINEIDLQTAFPRPDFNELAAAGEYGFNLIDKPALKEWLKEHRFSMPDRGIETDPDNTRWVEVERS